MIRGSKHVALDILLNCILTHCVVFDGSPYILLQHLRYSINPPHFFQPENPLPFQNSQLLVTVLHKTTPLHAIPSHVFNIHPILSCYFSSVRLSALSLQVSSSQTPMLFLSPITRHIKPPLHPPQFY
jgi:hypothetical protein